jgi:hypothetical protein
MRLAIVVVILGISGLGAAAPPGLTPATGALGLSEEDLEILRAGPMSDTDHALGTILAGVVGFGVGQAAQGRWGERGWIFTLGDSLATFGLLSGFADLANSEGARGQSMFVGSLLALGALRLCQFADAGLAPAARNHRYQLLRTRLDNPGVLVVPYVAPTTRGEGALAGLSLRF